MAKNRVYADGRFLYLEVPEGTESGDPVVVGDIPGVALIDRDDDKATIDTSGVYRLKVEAKDNDGNEAISVGDKLYYDATDDEITKEDSDKYFGYALEAVASGEEEEILVKIGY